MSELDWKSAQFCSDFIELFYSDLFDFPKNFQRF